jgi:hypothetical protein
MCDEELDEALFLLTYAASIEWDADKTEKPGAVAGAFLIELGHFNRSLHRVRCKSHDGQFRLLARTRY